MNNYPLVRTIYLYLFALLGLVLMTIGGVRFIDMGLKAFIFTKAEEEQRLYNKQPPMPIQIERIEKIATTQDTTDLTDDEKATIRQWLNDYKSWQEQQSKFDYIISKRHKDASFNLALIIVGLPLYLYHWGIIKRETKRKKNQIQEA